MSTKPKFFLLDAGPIIELHRLGLWDKVLDRAEIVVPRVIAEVEAEYWVREDNSKRPINTLADCKAGRLTVLDCEQAELRRTLELFDRTAQQSVDGGELHALTLLRCWRDESVPAFCSADRMAIVCLCLSSCMAGKLFLVHNGRGFLRPSSIGSDKLLAIYNCYGSVQVSRVGLLTLGRVVRGSAQRRTASPTKVIHNSCV